MQYFSSIFFGTFVLEDVALASGLALVNEGKMMLFSAFLACFLGIGLGDIILYAIGFAAGKLGLETRSKSDLLTYSIVVSRFIPGTRLPTYLAAGILRYPFWKFFILTVVTVFAWVTLTFAVGQSLRSVLMNHWMVTVVFILLFLKIVKSLLPKLSDYWERKALIHSWRKWMSFEFWPATLFYLPLVPYYIFLSIKYRSFLTPFYANPEIENAGLLGESKWDFLKHLGSDSSYTLKAIKIRKQKDFDEAREILEKEGFSYPFILKPDIGQRGFGVRIIRDDFDLTEYLLLADFEMIVQSLSNLPREAGVFYIRYPSDPKGSIFSVTDKHFPTVIGDGNSKLGDLILKDKRARIIASTYFSRHHQKLNDVPINGETVLLSECGNHCQGAVFLNGKDLITPELEQAIQKVADEIPNFYFGRLDIRYKDPESLMRGFDFEIVEINGAGSEATHIWDARTTLSKAYQTLFKQWRMLFEIGNQVKNDSSKGHRVNVVVLLKESFKVFFRKGPLSVSS